MTDERTRMVGAGYDAMADTWAEWSAQISDDPRRIWLNKLLDVLPDGDVLELGCGDGSRETALLASRYRTTAVDLSAEQLRRAREHAPNATFIHGDLVEIDFAAQSFDAVCAFYVLNHVARDLLPALFARVQSWLRPGGYFLATLGASDVENWHGEWLGVPMYFSGHVPERNRELLAGFAHVEDDVVAIAEPEGDVSFHWILART